MKKLLTTFVLLLAVTAVMAVPAKRGMWKTITLSDGTEMKATLQGDEFGHYWKGIDGKKYVKSGDTYVVMGEEAVQKAKAKRVKAQQLRAKKMKARKGAPAIYSGDKKGLIILAQFQDTKFQAGSDQTLYNNVANTPNYSDENGFAGSVADYFKAQSRGDFRLTFDVLGPVTVSKDVAYYGEDVSDEEGSDAHPDEMVSEAVNLVKDQVSDWKQYDWDGDGEVDQVFVLYAGEGQATGGDANTIWPHEFSLQYTWDGQVYGDRVNVAPGLYVNTYAVSNEIEMVEDPNADPDDESEETALIPQRMGIGTICHEFTHCLGLMDMYDTQYTGNFGMGDWDLMDHGSYNNGGFTPANYSSFEKTQIGWITPTELTKETSVSAMQAWNDVDECYKITNQANANEYYLLENRQQKGWDEYVPASGLLILHVDYDADLWAQNVANSTISGVNDHQRCTIFHADGKEKQNEIYEQIEELYYLFMFGLADEEDEELWNQLWDEYEADAINDVYPQGDNNELSNTSKPRAFTYNANSDGRKLMNIKISEITLDEKNGTIAFNFAPDNSGTEEGDNTEYSATSGTDPVIPDEYIFYESFNDCEGTGGNDGVFDTGAQSTFYSDNEDWDATAPYGGDQCARFGASKKSGVAKTPEMTLTNNTTLTFKAAPWGTDGTTLKLSAEGAKVVFDPAQVTMTADKWTTFTVNMSGAGKAKIVFTPAKRFFLDEVLVVDAVTNAIQDVQTVTRPADGKIYSIDGRYVGTDFGALKRGIYIMNGKKVVK